MTYQASRIHSEREDRHRVSCARCGAGMGANHRATKLGTTPLCGDCRESDPGLALLWRKKGKKKT